MVILFCKAIKIIEKKRNDFNTIDIGVSGFQITTYKNISLLKTSNLSAKLRPEETITHEKTR